MGSYKNFKVDRKKYSKGIKDIYKQPKNVNNIKEIKSKNERLIEGFKLWTSFYRENIHRFAEDYLGLKLHLFQKILLYLMNYISFFMYIAARGQGKSYLIAVFCICRCILYPGTKIIIASGTKGQAKLIITQKIEKDLYLNYPNVRREIKDIKSSNNECVVIFQNGSTIEAVTSTDNSRGYRGNILILDEFRLIKEENLKKVLRPFLNVNRQPPYLKNPKYAHLIEENKEIYISSAWFKNHWIWEKLKAFRNSMLRGKSYFTCALPYQLSVHHGLLSKKRVEEMKTEDDFDEIAWLMEYECLFFGESENAFFKLDDIQKCRTIVKPFYPIDHLEYLNSKGKRKKSTKQDGEIRVIGVDVALMGGDDNDNTVFTCMRLLPNGDQYIKQVPYIETLNGMHTEKQAIRLKQLFEDFEADYVAMDTLGNGLSLYDDCAKVLYDEERDVEYPAWCAMNNEEMKNRALDKNALPVIFSIKVVKAEVNHEIAMYLKTSFEKKTIKLLIGDIEGKDYLTEKHGYLNKSPEEQAKLIKPYVQTTILVNELVNLEYEIKSGFVKLRETGRNRKDRFSSLAYCNYFAKQLEAKLKKKQEDVNPLQFFFIKNPKYKA
jgi:hypothetical protein